MLGTARRVWDSLSKTQQTYMRALVVEDECRRRIPLTSAARVPYVVINGAYGAEFLHALADAGLFERPAPQSMADLHRWGVIKELESLDQRGLIQVRVRDDLVYVWLTRTGRAAVRAGNPGPEEAGTEEGAPVNLDDGVAAAFDADMRVLHGHGVDITRITATPDGVYLFAVEGGRRQVVFGRTAGAGWDWTAYELPDGADKWEQVIQDYAPDAAAMAAVLNRLGARGED